jgi:hypothetical protein
MGVVNDFDPDVIWASSDVLHLVVVQRVSNVSGLPYVIDLYDNYESISMTEVPGGTVRITGYGQH